MIPCKNGCRFVPVVVAITKDEMTVRRECAICGNPPVAAEDDECDCGCAE